MTYGQISKYAGNPWGARQVSRILHSLSEKYKLPWHRVISQKGIISLPGEFGLQQQDLLQLEGVICHQNKVDLAIYQFHPRVNQ